MIRTGLPLAALFLAACAEAPPKAPIVVVPLSPPIAASSAPAAVEDAPPAPPPEPQLVALPEAVACVLTTARWRGIKPRSDLRVRDGGPVFARVVAGKGSLHLPVGKAAGGAVLEVADDVLAVRGNLATADLWLHPGKAFVLGDAVIPLGRARLEWTSAKQGAVAVTFDPHEGIALVAPPLAGEVPCDALSLDWSAIDATTALPGAAKTGMVGLLRADRPVPLSLTAGGPVIANLTPGTGLDAKITVIGGAGASTRILWTREKSAIFGWVPSAQLEFPKQLPLGTGYGTGSGSGSLGGVHPLFRVVCPDDVTAIVDASGERWTVGRILAGATIRVMDDKGEYRAVEMRGNGIQIASGVKLLVPAPRILGCPKAP
jgi:hypothetical protein